LALLVAAADAAAPLFLRRVADMRLLDDGGLLAGGGVNADTGEEREAAAMSKVLMTIIVAKCVNRLTLKLHHHQITKHQATANNYLQHDHHTFTASCQPKF